MSCRKQVICGAVMKVGQQFSKKCNKRYVELLLRAPWGETFAVKVWENNKDFFLKTMPMPEENLQRKDTQAVFGPASENGGAFTHHVYCETCEEKGIQTQRSLVFRTGAIGPCHVCQNIYAAYLQKHVLGKFVECECEDFGFGWCMQRLTEISDMASVDCN